MKLAGILLLAAAFALVLNTGAFAQETPEGHEGHQHGEEASMCPLMVEGAKVIVENTADGVRIEIKSGDPEKIEQIRNKAAHLNEQAGETYACPMGDHTSNAPGKCPTCNMDLVKK